MAPVGGRPFLEHLMAYWINQGIKRFTLSVGYLAETVHRHFGESFMGCPVRYVVESEPLGTGGALRRVVSGTEWVGENVVVLNGDTWYEVDLDELAQANDRANAAITLALREIDGSDRYAGVEMDAGGMITAFGVAKNTKCLINGGCYIFRHSAVSKLLSPFPEKFSFEADLLPVAAEARAVAGCVQDKTFLDIGGPSDYHRAPAVLPVAP